MRVLKKLKTELPHDPAIPYLGMYPEKVKAGSQRDTRTPVLTAAKTWELPKCLSMDDGQAKEVRPCSGMLFRLEEEGNADTSMDLEDIMLSEVSRHRRQTLCDPPYVRHTDRSIQRQKEMVAGGGGCSLGTVGFTR